jgi:hypothetical protein
MLFCRPCPPPRPHPTPNPAAPAACSVSSVSSSTTAGSSPPRSAATPTRSAPAKSPKSSRASPAASSVPRHSKPGSSAQRPVWTPSPRHRALPPTANPHPPEPPPPGPPPPPSPPLDLIRGLTRGSVCPRPSRSPPRSAAARSAPSSPTSAAISASCRAIRCGANCSTPSSAMTATWPIWWRTSSIGRFSVPRHLASQPTSRTGPAIPGTFRRRPALISRRSNRRSVTHGTGYGHDRARATTQPASAYRAADAVRAHGLRLVVPSS